MFAIAWKHRSARHSADVLRALQALATRQPPIAARKDDVADGRESAGDGVMIMMQ